MRNIIFLLTAVFLFSSVSYAEDIQRQSSRSYSGNVLAAPVFSITQLTDTVSSGGARLNMTLVAELTDAAPTADFMLHTKSINDIQGYIIADKGCTLEVFALPIDNYDTTASASTTLTIADGGVTFSGLIELILLSSAL